MNEDVRETIDGYPEPVRTRLLKLRDLIYTIAAGTEGVGPLEETLKWGQISYLNPAGTTLRIGTSKTQPERPALFVHCQTSIVATMRRYHSDVLEFEDNRCILLPEDGDLDSPAVRDCIRETLTYHRS